jgi:hypothetical protein
MQDMDDFHHIGTDPKEDQIILMDPPSDANGFIARHERIEAWVAGDALGLEQQFFCENSSVKLTARLGLSVAIQS